MDGNNTQTTRATDDDAYQLAPQPGASLRHSRKLMIYTDQGWLSINLRAHGLPGTAPPLVCAHGLTRNASDFDLLAMALQNERLVVAIDFPGRGQSSWLEDKSAYGLPLYLQIASAVITWTGAPSIDWLGTSMGGLVGLLLAAAPGPCPIRKLVLNDIGAHVPAQALARIRDYLLEPVSCASLADLEQHFRKVYAPFGPMTDSDWRYLTAHDARTLDNGRVSPNYDPEIVAPMRAAPNQDLDLWPYWDNVRCPTLVLRGEHSDILSEQVAERMCQSERHSLKTIAGVGHVPALQDPQQIQLIADYLNLA